MNKNSLQKPLRRSKIRRILGKEFYILIRKFRILLSRKTWATAKVSQSPLSVVLISHQSLLLRPLREVDMQLQVNKVTNLQLAIAKLNNTLIRPGETFSFWKLVGRPTALKGYLEGLVLENGKIGTGVGGGLCQLGNLLYWMMLHTSLTVTERWRHGYDVFPDVDRKIPFGSGATLAYNFVDLQCCNHTDQQYQIVLWTDEKNLYGEIRANREDLYDFSIYETDHCFTQQWWGGYARCNKIWKKRIHKSTAEETDELVSENAAVMMYEPLLAASIKKE